MPNNIFVLGPLIIPLIGAILSLATSFNNYLQRLIAVAASVLAWTSSIIVVYQIWTDGTVQIYRLGNWPAPYGIVLAADMLSAVFGLMATTVLVGGMLYTLNCREKSIKNPAFIPLFLGMSVGLSGAFYTGDIFTLFVFIELMVITSVVLVAISDNEHGLEAAIKYLIISAMGTLFLLIGIAAVYASVSTLNMADIAFRMQTGEPVLLTRAAAVMLMAAFLLKSAVFPFHFWQPDFHTTAPTPVGAMLSSIVVKVGIYGVIRVVTLLFVGDTARNIEQILIVLGLIGIFFGSLGAMRTYNAKRMLAYSTFAQVGFILVALGWGTAAALAGAIIYAFNHAFIKSSLLMLTGVVSSNTKYKVGALENLVGAGQRMTFTSRLYFIGGLALAGVPPLNGFISKLAVVRGGIDAGSWLSLGLVVGAGILTLYYITRTWVLIFQRNPDEATAELKPPSDGDSALAPAMLIGVCVLLGLYATPLVDIVQMAVSQLSQSQIYISTVLGH